MATEKYTGADRAWAIGALQESDLTADSLPYTPEFDSLYMRFQAERIEPWDCPQFWKLLLAVRKRGLGRQQRERVDSPDLTLKQRARLRELMPISRGEVDRLPYTTAFDDLYGEFKKFLSKDLSQRDVWLACLRLAKSKMRPKAKPFVDKSLRLLKAAINTFNTIGDQNRADTTLVHLHHALEMLLKGSLIQQDLSVVDLETGHFVTFKFAVKQALHHPEGQFIGHADAQVLRAIDASRGDAYHGLLELDETELYLLCNTGVSTFGKILVEVFGMDLAEVLESRVLPISTIPLANSMILLDRKGEQIKALLNAGEQERALAATRSVLILNKAASDHEDAQISEAEVKGKLKEVVGGKPLGEVFPAVAALSIAQSGPGAVILLSVRGKKHEQVVLTADDGKTPIVAVRQLRPEHTWPHRLTEVVAKTGLGRNIVLAIIAELKLKDREDCCFMHGPQQASKTAGYSEKAIVEIRTFAESYDGDLRAIYAKHYGAKVKTTRPGKS
jgi:hypothetical protein